MSNQHHKSDDERLRTTKRILIVGDWVVDDHWVTGVHRSPTSSRTGKQHFRALHLPGTTVQSLGIAGRTASVFYRTIADGEVFCELACVGFWHRDDTNSLAAMLDPAASEPQIPYRITSPNYEAPSRAKFFNLSDSLKAQDTKKQQNGTTRVIRIYQNTGTKVDLIQRIDWELRPPSPENVWITDDTVLESESFGLKDFLRTNKIDAVVIKDIRKGVISSKLVKWLVANTSDAKWFLSSKTWNPEWFNELKNVDVRLVIIPPVAAQRAIHEGLLSCWTTRSGYLSKEAFHEIDNLKNKFKRSAHLIVVALPEGLTVLARDLSHQPDLDHDKKGFIQTEPEPLPLVVDVPMASVFFPSLASHLLRNEDLKADAKMSLRDIIQDAMGFTRQWMLSEVKRVEKPEEWNPNEEPRLEFPFVGKDYHLGKWQSFNWEKSKARWNEALNGLGIIERKGKKYLELWRGMVDVDGYICCVDSRRRILREIVRELRSFSIGGKQHHKSFLLIASPGSGKTYLASCLAKALGMRILPFNVTQMVSRNDLFDCFDTIITTQAQNPEKPILVFVDEVNAKLEGQNVYGTFLAPIQEGAYVRDGKTFHIPPCAWIFASTEDQGKPSKASEQNKDEKGSDFVSRLTLPPRDLKEITKKEEEQEKTEKVYLGVSLIRSVFPDVLEVSEKVLRLFYGLPKKVEDRNVEVREIEHFVRSFVYVQYGEVISRNIPTKDERFRKYFPDFWEDSSEGENIKIRMTG